jgi:methylated-DNA-[protein]-cysteine S-methyltransferase
MSKKILLRQKEKSTQEPWAAIFELPFGKLGVKTYFEENSLFISEVSYLEDEAILAPQNALANNFYDQINRYLENPSYVFELPLLTKGTSFQRKVWEKVNAIPVGQTMSYGELAKSITSGPRAIGGACGANPYPLIVPCHRVVAKAGIGGFVQQAGQGYFQNIKTWLLRHEGIQLQNYNL